MKLHFLGTGAGTPSKERNVSAIGVILTDYQNETWLFDCGEATQHQILHSPLRLNKLSRIFITHMHGDHIFGLPGVLSSRSIQGATQPLHIYGPASLRRFIETSIEVSTTHLAYELCFHEIFDGQQLEIPHFKVNVRKLEHGIPSFGFRITEEEQVGRLQVEQVRELNIPPGPIYRQLKEGAQIEWEGRILNGKEFLSPARPGRVLAILGDTRPTISAYQLAKNADILVHEATFAHHQAEKAKNYYHSTTVQAAKIAKEADVGTLILTHISPRFQLEDQSRLQREAAIFFPHTYVAYDGWSYTLGIK